MAGTMHLNPVELTLFQMVEDEPWDGDVQAPTGAFTSLMISDEMRSEVVATVGIDIGDELIGSWLIVEDEQGLLHFHKFASERDLLKEVAIREVTFAMWDDPTGSEVG